MMQSQGVVLLEGSIANLIRLLCISPLSSAFVMPSTLSGSFSSWRWSRSLFV